MSLFHNNILAGASGGSDPIYVDEVFSTFLYEGDEGPETITNGLDLSGEGGLTWLKSRSYRKHYLFDTERNADKYLQSSSTDAEEQLGFVLNSVAYGNSIYVAATDYGFYTSTNGTSWTAVTDADVAGVRYRTVKYLGSRFVAIGNHKTWATSTDGTNWTTSTISTDTAPYFGEIYYSNGRYMLKAGTASSGSVFISADNGSTWTSSFSGVTGGKLGVAGNAFVSLSTSAGSGGKYNTSGTTWTSVTPHSSGCTGIYQGNGICFAQFGYTTWKYSQNGSNWTQMTGGSGLAFATGFDYAPDTGKYWLVTQGFAGGTSQLGTSSDGTTWSFGTSLPNTGGNYIYICNDGTNFMIGTTGTTYYTSSDGTASSWTSRTAPSGISQTNQLLSSGAGGRAFIKETDDNEFHTNNDVTDTTTWSTVNAPTPPPNLISFLSNGFKLLTMVATEDNEEFASWTFRKAPGFFDVVTYTGDGNASKTISHSLGSTPGFLMVKRTDTAGYGWYCYHRGISDANKKFVRLESTMAEYSYNNNDFWGVSSTDFTVYGATTDTNINGATYVAYLFAHDDQSFGRSNNEAIIKCGSYTGNGTSGSSVNTIDLGFEPQWVMIKKTSATGNWVMLDTIRGFTVVGDVDEYINANTEAQSAEHQYGGPTSTGFQVEGTDGDANGNGASYIYIAIRRPHKPSEAGTDVFLASTADSSTNITTGFDVDLAITHSKDAGADVYFGSRLQGNDKLLESNKDDAQTSTSDSWIFDKSRAFQQKNLSSSSNPISWLLKRAPGFLDVVTYSGTGSNTTISHNLAAVPEMMIVKRRDASGFWYVYHKDLGNTKGLSLDGDHSEVTKTSLWNSTTPTSSVFSIGTNSSVNASGGTYEAFLFASLSGVSKTGIYTGTGSNIDVDCGFAAGARFVMIKRTDGSGDWYVWDTVRGIVSGNDPYLLMNSNAAEVTNTDYIDPLNAGFTITSSAPAALNTSGGTYIFLAIA